MLQSQPNNFMTFIQRTKYVCWSFCGFELLRVPTVVFGSNFVITMETPCTPTSKVKGEKSLKNENSSPFIVPQTPFMTKIGFGTGKLISWFSILLNNKQYY